MQAVKLLVADDEEIECRALEHKIRRGFPQVQVLESVYDGISLLERVDALRPDIVIVDINMPGLGGLDAVELIRARKLDIKVIINSSYSDFTYTQKALQLGASDYLLKPDTGGGLQRALKKVLAQLSQEREKEEDLSKDRNLMKGLYKVAIDKWLMSIVYRRPDEECYELLCRVYPDLPCGGYFTYWQSTEEGGLSEIEEALSPLCTFLGTETDQGVLSYLAWKGEAREILRLGQAALQKKGYFFRVGASSYQEEPSTFVEGAREAKAALLKGGGEEISLYAKREKKGGTLLSAEEQEKLSLLVEKGKGKEAKALLEVRYKTEEDVATMQACAACLSAGLCRYLRREHPSLHRPLPFKELGDAAGAGEVRDWMNRVIDLLCEALEDEGKEENPHVEKAIAYLEENLGKDISLEDVAGVLGISPFYLSRLFTQTKDYSFVELLTDMRLKEAIHLAWEGVLTTKQISESLGYASPKYFAKVFKKGTGLTVAEMRERI